jgi:N-methylhydantoinase A
MNGCRIGFDIGGTFTDIILFDQNEGIYHSTKTSSTPRDPSIGAVDGVAKILQQTSRQGLEVDYLSHGTTIATNAVLEGKLANCALVTTRGFKDVLEIGRQRRPQQYSFHAVKNRILVAREFRFEVTERVNYRGEVTTPLALEELCGIASSLKEKGVEAVAISFLFSFLNADHEQAAKAYFQANCPNLDVYLSSEVLPEYREYERTSTVVLNAAVAPIVSRYVGSLEAQFSEKLDIEVGMNLMKSSGGVMPSSQVQSRAVETVLSGPAAGAIAIAYFGGLAGYDKLIGFDIGGTSTDISVVVDQKPRITSEGSIGGYPFALPIVDISTIGAGGGSLAYLDVAGGLHVGPESAGADPGPVCYGSGGLVPTITDANLCLGRLNEHFFLGGEMPVDKVAAEKAIDQQIAKPMNKSLANACQGIFDVTLANMVRAIRVSSIEKGLDPREFSLVAFGGCGAVFTADVAEELGIKTVIVPQDAGLLSAKGLLVTDHKNDYSRTRISILGGTDKNALIGFFDEMKAQARAEFKKDNFDIGDLKFLYSLDLRYSGQAYEINVPIFGEVEEITFDTVRDRFNESHRRLYWWSDSKRELEIVNLRISVISLVPKATPELLPLQQADSGHAIKGNRPVFFKQYGEYCGTTVYDRRELRPGNHIPGPAIIESFDTTVVILPINTAKVDGYGNIIISVGG